MKNRDNLPYRMIKFVNGKYQTIREVQNSKSVMYRSSYLVRDWLRTQLQIYICIDLCNFTWRRGMYYRYLVLLVVVHLEAHSWEEGGYFICLEIW